MYDRLPNSESSTFLYLLMVGFAYAVGYAVQDIFTLFRVVRTKAGVPLNGFTVFLFKLFERQDPPKPGFIKENYEEAKQWLYTDGPSRFQDDHERIESLKQVGTTLGPCFILSGILLLSSPLITKVKFELIVTLAALFLGISLLCLGWLKVAQQSQYLLMRKEREDKRKEAVVSEQSSH